MAVWIDKSSVLTHEGKDIKYGDQIPKDVDPEILASLLKDGRASKQLPAKEQQTQVDALHEQIVKIAAERDAALQTASGLEATTAALEATIAGHEATIAELTKAVPADPVTIPTETPAAGPKGK